MRVADRAGFEPAVRLHSLLPPKLPPELAPCGGKNRDEATSLTSEVIDSRESTGRRGMVRNRWQRITKPEDYLCEAVSHTSDDNIHLSMSGAPSVQRVSNIPLGTPVNSE
jgi:hypothetical protein